MPPGPTSTNAAAIVVAAGNVVESTMRAVPPFVRIGFWASSRWLNEVGTGPAPATLSSASGPGAFAWKMNSSFSGMPAKARSGTPKFLARTSRGVWASQSVSEKVSSSLKSPSSKTSRNSQPSPSRPWIECGMPEGKFQRSPSPTSSWKARPLSSMAVIRARITAIDQEGRAFQDDVGEGDLWNFPSGIPHSVQGLEGDGCEFLLVFDDGHFSEDSTFSLTDWLAHTPREVLAKNFGVPEKAFAGIPEKELFIFQAKAPGRLATDKVAGAGPVPRSYSHRLLAREPMRMKG